MTYKQITYMIEVAPSTHDFSRAVGSCKRYLGHLTGLGIGHNIDGFDNTGGLITFTYSGPFRKDSVISLVNRACGISGLEISVEENPVKQ
jgi:hypothetical protein